MKKNYSTIRAFILALFFMTAQINAQLNGLYTINSGLPTGGTNFQTFTACAAVLNSLGVTGPVTINVVANSGPYNEQVTFNQAPGISLSNSIVINGNGNAINFTSSNAAAPWTICMGGADFMTVNNLNINGLGPNALTLNFFSGADNNTFNNCLITAPLNTTGTTNMIPVTFSGSNTTYASTANSGNHNTLNTCTVTGGYFNVTFYGLTGPPYNVNNRLMNCLLRNSYIYNIYNVYSRNTTISGCTIERPNQTVVTTSAGFYGTTGTAGLLFENNRIRKMFDGMPNPYTGTFYGVACPVSGVLGLENVIRNNVISDIKNFTGTFYGLFLSGSSYMKAYHNTIVNDDVNNTGTSALYGIYATGSTAVDIKNNIVSIGRGGGGTKYGLYYTSGTISSNYNNIYITSIAGTNVTGYYLINYPTLANWQTANLNLFDQQSVAMDAQFLSPGAFTSNDYLPQSPQLNGLGTPVGTTLDINASARSLTAPDIGAHEFLNTPCSGIPAANTINTPTFVMCANQGTTILGFSTNYTVNGLSFQWQVSTVSPVGPFTAIPGASLSQQPVPNPGVTSYYNAVVTCTNGGGNITINSSPITIAATTTSVVPYYENFEGVPLPGRMPNCSWSNSNSNVCGTYTAPASLSRLPNSGSKFASFFVNPAGQNYYYTNGIQLNAGVTYSAALMFFTEATGALNWTDLSILVGTSQTPVGQQTIVSTNGPAVAPAYKLLDGLFTVPTSGLYYVAVRATSNSGTAQYLSWDDLSITAPCTINGPSVNINAPASACSGKPLTIIASGGSNTYTWSTGVVGPVLNASPALGTAGYSLMATDLASGCTATIAVPITINPSPNVGIFATAPSVCEGQSIGLFASGALTYSWSNSTFGALNTVSPLVNTTYTVTGSNALGCTGTAVQAVVVNPAPVVNASASSTNICAGESVTLTGTGGSTYKWVSPLSLVIANPAIFTPANSAQYTLTGISAAGCEATVLIGVGVNACTGLNKINATNAIQVYPNPTNSEFTIELTNELVNQIEVTDIAGKVVMSKTVNGVKETVSLATLANGVYYVKVTSDSQVSVVKVMKN